MDATEFTHSYNAYPTPSSFGGSGVCGQGRWQCPENSVCVSSGPLRGRCACQIGFASDGISCAPPPGLTAPLAIVDECTQKGLRCHGNARCLLLGSSQSIGCVCNDGYTGNGLTCVAILTAASTASSVVTTPTSSAVTTPTSSVVTTPTSSVVTTPTSSAVTTPTSSVVTTPTSSVVTTPTSATVAAGAASDDCTWGGLHCHKHARCTPLPPGLYLKEICMCNDGFSGNGWTCVRIATDTSNTGASRASPVTTSASTATPTAGGATSGQETVHMATRGQTADGSPTAGGTFVRQTSSGLPTVAQTSSSGSVVNRTTNTAIPTTEVPKATAGSTAGQQASINTTSTDHSAVANLTDAEVQALNGTRGTPVCQFSCRNGKCAFNGTHPVCSCLSGWTGEFCSKCSFEPGHRCPIPQTLVHPANLSCLVLDITVAVIFFLMYSSERFGTLKGGMLDGLAIKARDSTTTLTGWMAWSGGTDKQSVRTQVNYNYSFHTQQKKNPAERRGSMARGRAFLSDTWSRLGDGTTTLSSPLPSYEQRTSSQSQSQSSSDGQRSSDDQSSSPPDRSAQPFLTPSHTPKSRRSRQRANGTAGSFPSSGSTTPTQTAISAKFSVAGLEYSPSTPTAKFVTVSPCSPRRAHGNSPMEHSAIFGAGGFGGETSYNDLLVARPAGSPRSGRRYVRSGSRSPALSPMSARSPRPARSSTSGRSPISTRSPLFSSSPMRFAYGNARANSRTASPQSRSGVCSPRTCYPLGDSATGHRALAKSTSDPRLERHTPSRHNSPTQVKACRSVDSQLGSGGVDRAPAANRDSSLWQQQQLSQRRTSNVPGSPNLFTGIAGCPRREVNQLEETFQERMSTDIRAGYQRRESVNYFDRNLFLDTMPF